MSTRLLFGIAILCTTLVATWAGTANSQVRFSPTPVDRKQPQGRVLVPTTQFDKTAALRALEKGTSKIEGAACWRSGKGSSRAGNIPILLLPYTPHLEELISLRKKARRGEVVQQSEEVLKTSIITKSDDKGRFQFTELKPGRYYLYAAYDFTSYRTENVYRGSAQGSYGTYDYYSPETRSRDVGGEMERMVEVKNEGEVVHTSLTNKGVAAAVFRCAILM